MPGIVVARGVPLVRGSNDVSESPAIVGSHAEDPERIEGLDFPIEKINAHKDEGGSCCVTFWAEAGIDDSWGQFQAYVRHGLVTDGKLDSKKLAMAAAHLDLFYQTARSDGAYHDCLKEPLDELIREWKEGLTESGYELKQSFAVYTFRNCDKWSLDDGSPLAPVTLVTVSGPDETQFSYNTGTVSQSSIWAESGGRLTSEQPEQLITLKREMWDLHFLLDSLREGGSTMWGESPGRP
ncbi:hypothetical protein QFC20_007162 [Naganishia adeliensis]|uniref:Uncharacterized protein n=1 Tax=Naganishia adeliensis TaxID=92952 RepID=A0ACC2V1S8_9TREE|nr:hypothetical protein QFC20_007162 [Naganishia adeliensis]